MSDVTTPRPVRRAPAHRSPTAPPRSFIWTRRIVLTLLTLFALLPVYVMFSSSLKRLEEVQEAFHWIPDGLTIQPYIDIWDPFRPQGAPELACVHMTGAREILRSGRIHVFALR